MSKVQTSETPSYRHVKRKRSVYSNYLKQEVTINDDCDCNTGGFYEKEITHHGFRGASDKVVKIYCDQCNKELKIIERIVNP